MRILVTGGLGFLGSTLTQRLIELGYTVRVLDSYTNSVTVPGDHDCETIHADIRDDLSRVVEGVDSVVHLAALPGVETCADNPTESLDVNVRGTLNLLRWATTEGVSTLVLASSVGAVLGTQVQPANEGQPPNPSSVYGWSKFMAELLAAEFDPEMTITVLRFTNMYGPRCTKKNSVIPKLLLRNPDTPFTIYGDGKQTRDFIHTDDVCRAITVALEKQTNGLFHIGCGRGISLLELVQTIERVTGDHIPLDFRDERPGDVRDNYTSIEKAGKVLGWRPEVELEEGVTQTYRWLRESGHIKNASDSPTTRRRLMNEILSERGSPDRAEGTGG